MKKTYRRRFLALFPAAFSLAIAVALFWAAVALFIADIHNGWATGMTVVAVLVGIPSALLAWRLLKFRVRLTETTLTAPKIRPLNIRVHDKKISEMTEKEKLNLASILDNKLFGGRYRKEKENIDLNAVESFDVAKIKTNYSKYIFLVFNMRDKTKRVIDVRPLGDRKAHRLVDDIPQFVKRGSTLSRDDSNPDDMWGGYLAAETGAHLLWLVLEIIFESLN